MKRRDHGTVAEYPDELANGSTILGVRDDGSVVYWDPVRETFLSGDVDPDADLSKLAEFRELGVDEDLGDVVRDIERSLGWHELAERAREALEDSGSDAASGSDSGSGS